MGRSILVTDGEQRSALAVVRSLGRAGHRVVVCANRPRSLAASSRYAEGDVRVTDLTQEPEKFVDDLARLVDEWGIDVILPMTDATCTVTLAHSARFSATCLPFPDASTFLRVSDKAHAVEVARSLGIATPAQTIIAQPDERPLPGTISFPVVIKPSRSISTTGAEPVTRYGVQYASDPSALERLLSELPASAFPVLLQQRIDGPGVGVFLLRWNREIVAEFAHRRIREKPPSGGVSVYRESIPLDRELAAASAALLEDFDWRGVAMIEFKRDHVTQVPYLMEINGRFWGSLQLAIDSGVDFPRLLVDLACGEPVVPVQTYRTGIRSRWWWGDVDQLLLRLRRSGDELALPPSAKGRLAAVGHFAQLWRRGDRSEVFRWTDPRPFWRETVTWMRPNND